MVASIQLFLEHLPTLLPPQFEVEIVKVLPRLSYNRGVLPHAVSIVTKNQITMI